MHNNTVSHSAPQPKLLVDKQTDKRTSQRGLFKQGPICIVLLYGAAKRDAVKIKNPLVRPPFFSLSPEPKREGGMSGSAPHSVMQHERERDIWRSSLILSALTPFSPHLLCKPLNCITEPGSLIHLPLSLSLSLFTVVVFDVFFALKHQMIK